MKWYEYNIKDRYEKIYNSFSLEDFWNWWSDKEDAVMEVRIKSFDKIKEFSLKYKMPMSASGLYVKSAKQLQLVVDVFGKTTTMWFGINPKKRMMNKYGKMRFAGTDVNITQIKFLFIDIDRVKKDGPANKTDLMNADFLSNKILNELEKSGFNKNYLKICSGNGVQLLIKLDIPIKIPEPEYNQETSTYIEDALFNNMKNTIRLGIGKVLSSFSTKFRKEYNVEVDNSGFNMGRVGALHKSFNFKYDIPIPRGIVEIKSEGTNDGMSDYLKHIFESKQEIIELKKQFNKNTKTVLLKEYKIIENALNKNVLVDLMLKHTFPDGGINNTLWYGIKILLHHTGISLHDNEYINIHNQLKSIHQRDFAQNGLEEEYKNNDNGAIKKDDIALVGNMVNKYLRLHKIQKLSNGAIGYHKPIFPIKQGFKQKNDILLIISLELLKDSVEEVFSLSTQQNDCLKDLADFAFSLNNIRRGETINDDHYIKDYLFSPVGEVLVFKELVEKTISFTHAFYEKWGKEVTMYMMKYYFNDYLNYR
jgi:hypothetical protein